MGSTKKHRDRKRKHRARSDSESRSSSPVESKRRKHKHKHQKKRKRKHQSSDSGDDKLDAEIVVKREGCIKEKLLGSDAEEGEIGDDFKLQGSLVQQKQPPEDEETKIPGLGDDDSSLGASKGDISLSIEETNKIRAKLGLKPLDDASLSKENETPVLDFVHKPAENLGEKERANKLRERLAERRERRRVEEQLQTLKGLGEAVSDDEDVSSWVQKNRRIQEEKEAAARRAKVIEEMDREFGIGELVEDVFEARRSYTAKDLLGLRVEHDREKVEEGKEIILTLQDKDVLTEDPDTLMNVNLAEDERHAKNVAIRSKKPGYDAFEEKEEEGEGEPRKGHELLKKYDEEIEGEKKKSFLLGDDKAVAEEKQRREIRNKLEEQKKRIENLNTLAPRLMTEYYTPEEMAKFKKPKKKKKVRTKMQNRILSADDLLPLADTGTSDLGSRNRSHQGATVEEDRANGHYTLPMDVDDEDLLGPTEDLEHIPLEPDEAELELQMSLHKARKLKQLDQQRPDDIAQKMEFSKLEGMEVEGTVFSGNSIVLNATAEFARSLGDVPTYGRSGNRGELEEEEEKESEIDSEERSRWSHIGEGQEEMSQSPGVMDGAVPSSSSAILEEEPEVGTSVFAALKLAQKKGYLETEVKKQVGVGRVSMLRAQNYSIEDKTLDEDRSRRGDRFHGPVTDFKEKDSYKPEVKLEYIDDSGRLLTPKEAFRYLSHKFHGKGSGKMKTEKRMRKVAEQSLVKQMSSTDTPLGTVEKMIEKHKESQTPFIVLSGSKQSAGVATIIK
ncbi:unnamed protein product [Darwinula stevensoni]|uniref:U4/U6.U5 tri-snRNP-associated protein 1 n=1 Tax=Darwinula stevensoni TaxID=69355 RepID=A0A7R9A1W2_9CRUS|nr:unnamed protein product [Darwinula stevensoni]CAG0884427.1 unnamed protein product [Darwinula stevensoni]